MKVMLEWFFLAQFPQILSGRFKELFLALKFSLLLKIICLHGTNSELQMNFNSCVSGEVTTSNEFSSASVPDHLHLVVCFRKAWIQLRILSSVSSASGPRNYVFIALMYFSICISRLYGIDSLLILQTYNLHIIL